MSIWKELYEIFDKERARWQTKNTDKQALVFEIQSNLTFLADAIQGDLNQADIVKGLQCSVFERAMKNGLSLNSIANKKVTANTIGGFVEFKKYIGKDTDYLVKNAYLKIGSLTKVVSAGDSKKHPLKFKSLFRFLMLLVTHIEGGKLTRR